LEAEDRTLRARIAAHTLHATHDSRDLTAAARSKFLGKFYAETDPTLPEEERIRRAEHLLRAHMTRLALRSAKFRKKRDAR
jgi:hypothetical protein